MPGRSGKQVCWKERGRKHVNDAGERQGKGGAHPKTQQRQHRVKGSHWSWITYHFGLEGWLHQTFLQQSPVDGLEEGVGFDVASHSQSLGWIPFKQLQPSRGPG